MVSEIQRWMTNFGDTAGAMTFVVFMAAVLSITFYVVVKDFGRKQALKRAARRGNIPHPGECSALLRSLILNEGEADESWAEVTFGEDIVLLAEENGFIELPGAWQSQISLTQWGRAVIERWTPNQAKITP